jgi:Neuraminidase (sialidase)
MKHFILYKQKGIYAGFPVLNHLPDGRLTVGIPAAPFFDHYGIGDWIVLLSEDEGETWTPTNEPSLPQCWQGTSPREKYDRFAAVMPDGTFLASGSVGWEVWPKDKAEEAKAMGLLVRNHPNDADAIPSLRSRVSIVGGHKLFAQYSSDNGQTWERQEWVVPGVGSITAFPRSTQLADRTILVPVYGVDSSGKRHQNYVWRSADDGKSWQLLNMAPDLSNSVGSETAFVEVSPGLVLAHTRSEGGYLMESWSNDAGITWTHPLRTAIWGYPPHLLRLRDGRILCSFGYRRDPMGVRAVLSDDGGRSWDFENVRILRDDGGTPSEFHPKQASGGSDVGYPISTQLSDGSILTVYYLTLKDGITHAAATRWSLDE